MSSRLTAAQVAEACAAELSLIRGLLDLAIQDSTLLYKPRRRRAKSTVFSGMVRDKFLELAENAPKLRGSRVRVFGEGEDWVRFELPIIGVIRLRTCPSTAHEAHPTLVRPDGTNEELFERSGPFVMFWTADRSSGLLDTLTLAEVASFENWQRDCEILSKYEVEAGAAAMPVNGAGSAEDELEGVVGRWEPGADDEASAGTSFEKNGEERDDDNGDATGVEGAG